jgi:hypothetical protein
VLIIRLPKWIYEITFWLTILLGIYVILDSSIHSTSLNPFFARSGNLLASHVLTWTFIGIGIIIIRLKTPKQGLMNALQTVIASFLMIGIGEGVFQFFNATLFWHFPASTIITNLLIFMAVFLAVVLRTDKWINKKRFIWFIVSFLIYMLGWRILGLPQTIVLVGKVQENTVQYYSYITNSLELGQWLIACLGFAWSYRGFEKK